MAENLALRHGEFRIGRNNLVQDIPVIVKAFGTVKNRTLLHGKTPTIGFDAIVGLDTLDGHVHANRNLVSRLPFTRNDLVSSLVCQIHGFAVDRNGKIVIGSGNSLAVERARHRFSDAPSGDTDEKLEIGNGGIKSKLDIAVPRICRFLRKLDFAALEFKLNVAFDKEVYIDFVVSRRIRHARNLRNETDDIYRTARATEPLGALVSALAFKRIGIEKLGSADGNAAQKAVVDDSFDHIEIFGLARAAEHTLVPKGVSDGSASLEIRIGIGKIEVDPERFMGIPPLGMPGMASCADTAVEMEFAEYDILPKFVDGLQIALVAGKRGNVRHAAIHIRCANGVPHGLFLFAYRQMVLKSAAPD